MNEKLLPLFSSARLQEQAFSYSLLLNFLQQAEKEYHTGLMEISPAPGLRFALLFVRGRLVNAYQRAPETSRIPTNDWQSCLPTTSGIMIARSLALTPQTLRMVKIYIEQVGSGLSQSIPTQALEDNVQHWGQPLHPSLINFSWPDAQALALLPGSGQPCRHTIFISGEQILHSAGGMATLYHWRESICQVTRYSGENPTPAWKEYLLHRGFVQYAGHILRRLDELMGRLSVSAIIREINFAASAHAWNINITPISITDQAVFANIEEASLVYKTLLDILQHNVSNLVGDDLLHILGSESLARLQKPYHNVLQSFLETAETTVIPTSISQDHTP